jgi:hypothetical protein
MTARKRRPDGRGTDQFPGRMEIIDSAAAIEGILDSGSEYPWICESLATALRVLRCAARLDPPGAEVSAHRPTTAAMPSAQSDLGIALRLLDRLLDNPALIDRKMREPVATSAALVERALSNMNRKMP